MSVDLPFVPLGQRDIEQSIGTRFESQVSLWPSRPAIACGPHRWSYEELNARANKIAHALLECGGQGNEPVALLYDHGAPLVAAILGALKAGKMYVALDPADPDARLIAALEVAEPSAVVADSVNETRALALAPVGAVTVADPADTSGCAETNPDLDVTADTLAYLFFTSGSTGTPKGVVDNHRNVLHNILRYTNSLHISPSDRLTLLQSCAFSGSVSSLFCALLNGATSLPFDLRRRGVRRLGGWLSDEEVTIYHSVPSIFRSVCESVERLRSVRVVRLEGDRVVPADVNLFRRHFSEECLLSIGLGATETGLTCQYIAGGGRPFPEETVPVGYPVDGVSIAVVGDDGNEVKPNEPGQIVVRSRHLAVGYWNRPDLTAAAFTSLNENGSERAYRTGDLGRMRQDGCVEYLGRKDHRLKIRGNVVEPSIVEAALIRTGLVREAVTGGRVDAHGEMRLVAWIVASGETPPASGLRAALADVLPSWMIPSAFMRVNMIPITANGKIDRTRLPAPAVFLPDGLQVVAGPTNIIEATLARIWKKVLRLESVGMADDFFELGGDSLSAVTVAMEIERELGRSFNSASLFSMPTIAGIARTLEEDDGTGHDSPLVCLQPFGALPPMFCVHPGDGEVLFYRALADRLAPERPFYALHGWSSDASDEQSVEILASRYAEKIREVQSSGPYLIGGYCFGAFVALEMARQIEAAGDRVSALVCFDTDGQDRLVGSAGDAAMIHLRRLRRMRGPERLRYLLDRASYRASRLAMTAGGIAGRLAGLSGMSVRGGLRRVLRHDSNFRAGSRYVARAWGGRVIYFHPRERSHVDPLAFWSGVAMGRVEVVTVDGSPSNLFEPAQAAEIAAALRRMV